MTLTGYSSSNSLQFPRKLATIAIFGIAVAMVSGCESLLVPAEKATSGEAVSVTEPEPVAAEAPVDTLPVPAPPTEPPPTPTVAVEPAPPKPVVQKPLVCPAPKPCPKCPAAILSDKVVFGQLEDVTVSPPGFVYQARIDTGAEGTSVHATEIVKFERDGERWVRFNLIHPKTGEPQMLEREVSRRVKVKQVELEGFERRLVVILDLTIGTVSQQTEVSLVDRSDMEYPVLIGRNFLQNQAIVDVNQEFIAK